MNSFLLSEEPPFEESDDLLPQAANAKPAKPTTNDFLIQVFAIIFSSLEIYSVNANDFLTGFSIPLLEIVCKTFFIIFLKNFSGYILNGILFIYKAIFINR